ncbi:DUF2163 domain-containing protein [Arsenicitalea aurantiaca]|uniref:DUF2163 domain-containing protein n=1 Tax=Arsenicitalea aurantiaca TaxID=1783274 RepID=A0A433XAB0_9HYPH|nr:DUF2163 domain-containing protein [Arsenicitalea aurantiaca]RUT30992.1 DUF2163 domain-containing protein [Arsenicitalea aurantiaca]
MRALDPGFAAHIASGATRLCTCWRIARSDGVVLGFTDHDEPVAFGGETYLPAGGLDGGEVSGKLGAQTDTTEVVGVLRAEAITEEDILLGRYDGAVVETFRVHWPDPEIRHLVRRASIGEIVREDGVFRAELRSGQHALSRPQGRLYQPLCDAELGDARCGVNVEGPAFSASGSVLAIEDRYRLRVAGLSGFEAGWFGLGRLRWSDGRRVGIDERIVAHDRVGGVDVLSFSRAVGEWVVPGDGFTALAGCDRRFATCREKFANGLNFRGFPHIPGSDFVLRYPKKGDRRDGRALVR